MSIKELFETTPNVMVVVTLADLKEFANDLKEDKKQETLLNTRIVDCNLSTRTLIALKRADIQTIGDILKFKRNQLLCFKGIGKTAISEIEDFLTGIGLKFS